MNGHLKTLLFIILMVLTGVALSQAQINHVPQPVFNDYFNQEPVNPINSSGDPAVDYSVWTTVDPASLSGGTALIENYAVGDGMLKLLARHSSTEQTGNRTEVSAPISSFHESFSPVLSANTDTLVWVFTAKQNRSSAGGTNGFSGTQTGMAVVLASDSASWGTEQGSKARGYAVTFLKPAGNMYCVSLSRFDGGLSNYTVIAGNKAEDVFGDFRTWVTVRVEYYPATNEWNLFFRDEGSTSKKGDIFDSNGMRLIDSVVDDTFTNAEMTHFGFALNTPAPGAQGAHFNAFWVDDFSVSLGKVDQDEDDGCGGDNENDYEVDATRPWIWVQYGDKAAILDNISNHAWAASLMSNLRSRVDATRNTHKADPSAYINSISAIPGSRSAHVNALDLAVEAGILYFLCNNNEYAQLAADIVHHYAMALGVPDYKQVSVISNEDAFMESRIIFPRYAIAYDFIYNFVNSSSTTVYDKVTGTRVPFNHAKAQQTSKNFADLVLKTGGLRSNHSILEGGGALYNIMCITDSLTRESYFSRYWNGDTQHDAFNGYTLNEFSNDQGVWPESMSYGKGPHGTVLRYMETIDRFKPELHVVENNLRVLDGAFVYDDFIYPNNFEIAAYGDSRRNRTETEALFRYVLRIAEQKQLTEFANKATLALQQRYQATGYSPKIETVPLDWTEPLKLLWGVHFDLLENITDREYSTTTAMQHAGVVLQRNYNVANPETHGLVYYTGGAHYVHSHLSGLDMELYGAGYVMGGVAADMPSVADRASDINRHYYRIYAGHNTVIVNGTSQGRGQGSWKSDGILWQNTTMLQAAEPKPLEEPISSDFCFSAQFLDDKVNNCLQQRTNAIVRTSPTSGYYVDFFRSTSNAVNNFHDYVYHNIGDEMTLTDFEGTTLPVNSSGDRYQSFNVTYNGAVVKFPGWHYFENVYTTDETINLVRASIKLNTSSNRYMHITLPGGVGREYTRALAPPILESAAGYNKKKAQLLTIRQYGEAWDRPFVAVYEPSFDAVATVQSVDPMMDGVKIIGSRVVSQIDQTIITDYILALEKEDSISIPEYQISFMGRFGIIRREKQTETTEKVTLYIGEGTRLDYADLTMSAGADKKKLEQFSDVQILPDPRFTVNTSVMGGGGSVSKTPEQVDYLVGSSVELTAHPEDGYVFNEWTGDVSSTEETLTISIYSNMNIVANFTSTTSIQQTSDAIFTVTPNPSDGIFSIHLIQAVYYKVFNLNGNLLMEGNASEPFDLDLRGYNKAMYILHLETQDGCHVKRLLKL